jgi:hypothetical protein
MNTSAIHNIKHVVAALRSPATVAPASQLGQDAIKIPGARVGAWLIC